MVRIRGIGTSGSTPHIPYTWDRYLREYTTYMSRAGCIRGIGTSGSTPHIPYTWDQDLRESTTYTIYVGSGPPGVHHIYMHRRCVDAHQHGVGGVSTHASAVCRCIPHTHAGIGTSGSTPARRRQSTVSGYLPRGPLRGSREPYLTQLAGIGNARRHRSARAPPSGGGGGRPVWDGA